MFHAPLNGTLASLGSLLPSLLRSTLPMRPPTTFLLSIIRTLSPSGAGCTFRFRRCLLFAFSHVLIVGICLLLALSPFAFHGVHWIRIAALVLAVLIGIGNALLHIGGSILYRRWMAGILSSPVLLVVGGWFLWSCVSQT